MRSSIRYPARLLFTEWATRHGPWGNKMALRGAKVPVLVLMLGLAFALRAGSETGDDIALRHASDRGHEIFVLDETAQASTDEMLRKIPDPRAAGIAGWIVEERADHLHSTFYGLKDQHTVAIFIADTRGRAIITSKIIGPQDEGGLTPVQTRMVKAREVALHEPVMRCTDARMNTVVIPPASAEQPVDVYVLSAQARPSEYPLGGHQLFRIDEKGEVASQRKFTNSCWNVSSTQSGSSQPAALFVTHLLDATPTEIHVFASLMIGLPIFVATAVSMPPNAKEHRVWKVSGETISLASDTER